GIDAPVKIIDFVPAEGILCPLSATDRLGAIEEISSALARVHAVDARRVKAALLERETLGSTAIGKEIAVPHAKFDLPRTAGVLGISPRGIHFGAADELPVRIFVGLLSPAEGAGHLKALAAVAQELSDPATRSRLLAARDARAVYEIL